VENHDHRSCHRRPLTWRFSRVFPGPQHTAIPCRNAWYRSRTEEARGSNPLTSTPPPLTSGNVGRLGPPYPGHRRTADGERPTSHRPSPGTATTLILVAASRYCAESGGSPTRETTAALIFQWENDGRATAQPVVAPVTRWTRTCAQDGPTCYEAFPVRGRGD
jgi:hypothetical protein